MNKFAGKVVAQSILATVIWGMGTWAIAAIWYVYEKKEWVLTMLILAFMVYAVLETIFTIWGRWW